MEKLTPQNEHQEHMVQVLLAIMQGIPVQYKGKRDGWTDLQNPILYINANTKYFIVPKPTPLPISLEMWRMFNKKWQIATMSSGERIYLHEDTSLLEPVYGEWSTSDLGADFDTVNKIDITDLIEVNTDTINWRLSVTRRPKGV